MGTAETGIYCRWRCVGWGSERQRDGEPNRRRNDTSRRRRGAARLLRLPRLPDDKQRLNRVDCPVFDVGLAHCLAQILRVLAQI